MRTPTIFFKTAGCRLNQAETASIRAGFEAAGWQIVSSLNVANVCVIHSCAVTAKAEKNSLRMARTTKRLNPDCFVVLTGCAAEILLKAGKNQDAVDLMTGQSNKFQLVKKLKQLGFPPHPLKKSEVNHLIPSFETTRAIVKIQDGCDFLCSYCIVPHARGRSQSRSIEEIENEIAELGASGFKEIVLTGANTGCYNHNGKKLPDLLERLEAISEIERIRISSVEISTIERSVIDFMAQSKKLCRFLHLPLQSGDDTILRAMRRRYTARQYRDAIQYAYEKLGSFGLGTDIIAGFPGETDDAFAATEQMIKDLPFNNLHVFPYSKRRETIACNLKGVISEKVKKKRVARLKAIGKIKREEFAESRVGKKSSVLIESVEKEGIGVGWTDEYLRARISGEDLTTNKIVCFVAEQAEGDILTGRVKHKTTIRDETRSL